MFFYFCVMIKLGRDFIYCNRDVHYYGIRFFVGGKKYKIKKAMNLSPIDVLKIESEIEEHPHRISYYSLMLGLNEDFSLGQHVLLETNAKIKKPTKNAQDIYVTYINKESLKRFFSKGKILELSENLLILNNSRWLRYDKHLLLEKSYVKTRAFFDVT